MIKWNNFPHVYASQQFSREFLEQCLFPETQRMEKIREHGTGGAMLSGRTIFSLFWEPSTRTRFSFQKAMQNLGGSVIFTENAGEFSSWAKGETLEDSILVLNQYDPDAIVMRYSGDIGAMVAAGISKAPIISAGDRHPKGLPKSPFANQHPTQALLDIYTIQKRLGGIDRISIAMVGDLANGRTVRSLAYNVAKFNNVSIYFVSPACSPIGDDIKKHLIEERGVKVYETNDLREVAGIVDVVYQTRTQKECGMTFDRNDHSIGYFIVDRQITGLMRKNAIIMHPLPRVDEITPDVDEDPRAVYLTDQVKSGLHTRMALLKMVIAPED